MSEGVKKFLEVIFNQELGEVFRRYATKAPVPLAGIIKEDICPQ